jgi:hypothetical protein
MGSEYELEVQFPIFTSEEGVHHCGKGKGNEANPRYVY